MEKSWFFGAGVPQVWVQWYFSSSENINVIRKAQKALGFIPNINLFISQVGTQITYFFASYFLKN